MAFLEMFGQNNQMILFLLQIYSKTSCTLPYIDDNSYMKNAAKALNVLYTHSGSYEPYLVLWLFPLQLATEQNAGQSK